MKIEEAIAIYSKHLTAPPVNADGFLEWLVVKHCKEQLLARRRGMRSEAKKLGPNSHNRKEKMESVEAVEATCERLAVNQFSLEKKYPAIAEPKGPKVTKFSKAVAKKVEKLKAGRADRQAMKPKVDEAAEAREERRQRAGATLRRLEAKVRKQSQNRA